jgi:hypothetical protein
MSTPEFDQADVALVVWQTAMDGQMICKNGRREPGRACAVHS